METKKLNIVLLSSIVVGLAFLGILFVNGCSKSEPQSGSSPEISDTTMGDMDMPTEAVTADNGQTMCPVMGNNPINPNVFVEYKGKKVYFCCSDCEAEFLKNPDKYVAKLPQFQE